MAGSGKVRQIVVGLEVEKRKLREEVQALKTVIGTLEANADSVCKGLKEENQRLRIQIEGLESERDTLQDALNLSADEPVKPVGMAGEPGVGGEFSEDNPAVPCDDLEDSVAGTAGADLGPSPY